MLNFVSRLRSRSGDRGFTMIELLIVISIMGGIMAAIYGVLFGTLNGKRQVELRVEGARIGPLILDQIERDIRHVYAANLDFRKVFVGKNYRISGKDADKVHLVSYTPSTMRIEERDKLVFADVNEIGYVVTQSQNGPNGENNSDFMTLWRREDFFVDDEPLEGGEGIPLYRRILGFKIRYFDQRGKDAKEEEKWDPDSHPNLPAAMEISLDYEVEPRDRSTTLSNEELIHRRFSCRRFITFGDEYAAAMSVRSATPTAPLDASGGLGGPGGGGGGKGGNGGGPGSKGGKGGGGGINMGTGGTATGGHSTGTGGGGGKGGPKK